MSIRHLPELLLVALMAMAAAAQAADDEASQRQRIALERQQVDARAQAGERACADRFAVSACLAQVRAERRVALQQLDHQRALLDVNERKRRAADRAARIRARQDAQAKADESRLPPAESQSAEPRPAESVAPAAVTPDTKSVGVESALPATPAPSRRARQAAAAERAKAADRAAAAKRRAEQAAAHRDAVEHRNRVRAAKGAPAQGLPVPPPVAASAAAR